MVERRIGERTIRLVREDITDIDVEAFVFDITEDAKLGSGYGSAIATRGGRSVQEELDAVGQCPTGEAIITVAGDLKAKHIIHAVGPTFQEEDTEGKLRTTVLNSMKRAEEAGVERLALPAMGAGYYGTPSDLCARVMLEVIKSYLQGETGITEIVVCVFDTSQYNAFKAQIEKVT